MAFIAGKGFAILNSKAEKGDAKAKELLSKLDSIDQDEADRLFSEILGKKGGGGSKKEKKIKAPGASATDGQDEITEGPGEQAPTGKATPKGKAEPKVTASAEPTGEVKPKTNEQSYQEALAKVAAEKNPRKKEIAKNKLITGHDKKIDQIEKDLESFNAPAEPTGEVKPKGKDYQLEIDDLSDKLSEVRQGRMDGDADEIRARIKELKGKKKAQGKAEPTGEVKPESNVPSQLKDEKDAAKFSVFMSVKDAIDDDLDFDENEIQQLANEYGLKKDEVSQIIKGYQKRKNKPADDMDASKMGNKSWAPTKRTKVEELAKKLVDEGKYNYDDIADILEDNFGTQDENQPSYYDVVRTYGDNDDRPETQQSGKQTQTAGVLKDGKNKLIEDLKSTGGLDQMEMTISEAANLYDLSEEEVRQIEKEYVDEENRIFDENKRLGKNLPFTSDSYIPEFDKVAEQSKTKPITNADVERLSKLTGGTAKDVTQALNKLNANFSSEVQIYAPDSDAQRLYTDPREQIDDIMQTGRGGVSEQEADAIAAEFGISKDEVRKLERQSQSEIAFPAPDGEAIPADQDFDEQGNPIGNINDKEVADELGVDEQQLGELLGPNPTYNKRTAPWEPENIQEILAQTGGDKAKALEILKQQQSQYKGPRLENKFLPGIIDQVAAGEANPSLPASEPTAEQLAETDSIFNGTPEKEMIANETTAAQPQDLEQAGAQGYQELLTEIDFDPLIITKEQIQQVAQKLQLEGKTPDQLADIRDGVVKAWTETPDRRYNDKARTAMSAITAAIDQYIYTPPEPATSAQTKNNDTGNINGKEYSVELVNGKPVSGVIDGKGFSIDDDGIVTTRGGRGSKDFYDAVTELKRKYQEGLPAAKPKPAQAPAQIKQTAQANAQAAGVQPAAKPQAAGKTDRKKVEAAAVELGINADLLEGLLELIKRIK